MPYENLADFLSELQDHGELVRIAAEVEADLEIAAITDRVCKSPDGGPALFFENVRGRSLPVVTNLLGSRRRLCRALGVEAFEQVAERIVGLIQPDVPAGWLESLRLVPQFAQLTKLPPRIVKTAVCQQVVRMGRDIALDELPIPRSWPQESSPTITLGQVYTRSLQTGRRNVGLYPLQVCGENLLCVQWSPHHDGSRHYREYQQAGQQMPVSIALGGDPVYTLMACAPLPPFTDECLFGGFLRDRNIDLVKCRSNDLEVPAHAEIVLEGYIDAEQPTAPAGSFAAPTGFATMPEDLPVIRLTALTHRSNPLFPAMIYGKSPMEDFWIGQALERIFLPLVRLFIPELVDYHLPLAGAGRHLLFVSIRKEYPQQARKVMNALWSFGRLMVTKTIVVVDADVDVHNEQEVWFRVGANVHPGRDVVFCDGPGDWLDHAAPIRGLGQKMGLDATRKLPEEGHSRPWPDELQMSDDLRERVNRRWGEYGL
jgi:4-hydroxy-3-polyprenylbenzoate decarboxylase